MSDVTGLGQVASAGIGAAASLESANIAAQAANKATEGLQNRYDTTRSDLLPYNTTGQAADAQLQSFNNNDYGLGSAPNYLAMAQSSMPGTMTQSQLEQTPGYQFQMNQGLQQTQNSAASRGLGVSGAALKGAAAYATGLANSNYETQFANQQQQYTNYMGLNSAQQGNVTNMASRLQGTASLGENAASQTGTTGATLGNSAAATTLAGGAASGSGLTGAANALTGSYQNYLKQSALTQGTAASQGSAGITDQGSWDTGY